MSETFSLKRFYLLLVKTVSERPVQLFGIFGISMSAAVLIYFLLKNTANFEIAQLFSFTIGLVGGGCLLASAVFGHFSDNANSASFLTLPASALEKWLCGIVIVVIFLAGFLLFFRGLDAFFVHLYHQSLSHQDARYQAKYDSVYLLSFPDLDLIFIFFFNAAAAMLVGSLYFNKIAFIKVALIICAVYFFTFLLNYLVNSILFTNMVHTYPFHSVVIKNGDEPGVVELPPAMTRISDAISLYILPSILLIISYTRLKEKEA
jgi:hypothetical protein